MPSMYRVRTSLVGGSGADQLSTQYFDATSPYTAQHAADAVDAFWAAIRPHMSVGYSAVGDPSVEIIDTTTGQPTGAAAVTRATNVGTAGGDALPWANQGLVQLRSGIYVSGREQRGRIFIPGTSEIDNSGGVPIAAYRADILLAAANMMTDVNSGLGVYSRKHRIFTTVTLVNVWAKWAVLTSRRD